MRGKTDDSNSNNNKHNSTIVMDGKHSDAMMTPEINDSAVVVFLASVVDSSMMTSNSYMRTMTTEAEVDSLGALVSSISKIIKSGVSVATDMCPNYLATMLFSWYV